MVLWVKVQVKKFQNRKKKHRIKIRLESYKNSVDVQKIAMEIADDMEVSIISYKEDPYSSYVCNIILKCRNTDKVTYVKRFLDIAGKYLEKVEFR